MTGEITLRGRILPIGGLKNKALAAYSVGIRHLLAPAENEKDLAEIPAKIRHDLTITLVATMDDVIRVALLPAATDATTDAAPVEATSAITSAEVAPDEALVAVAVPAAQTLVASVEETTTITDDATLTETLTTVESPAPAEDYDSTPPLASDLGEAHEQPGA